MGQSPTNPLDELSPKRRALLELLMREKGSERKQVDKIPARAAGASAPLSFAQRSLWFLQQYMPDSPAYNVVAAYRMVGELNVGALENALTQVCARHEVLRARISAPDGEPIQVFAPPAQFVLEVRDLRNNSVDSRQEAVRLASAECRRPFDLSAEAPVRGVLWRVGAEEHLFALVIHHIVTDGWSMSLILRELAAFYDAELSGTPLQAPPLPIQYADYAAWQHAEFMGNKRESELSYWRGQLAGADKLRLIPDFPRPAKPTDRGRRIERELDPSAVSAVRRIAEEENSTLFAATFALFAELLHRYTRQDDVVVGIPSAGRSRQETEPLVGMFINMLALRADLSGNPSFRELLRRVTEISLQAQSHQDVPFEVVVEALNPGRDPGYNPLFQVMFALQNQASEPPSLRGLAVYPVEVTTNTAKVDLTLEVYEHAGRHTCVIEYNDCLFEPATVERMVEHYSRLLNGARAHPEQPLATIRLITDEEANVVIHEWNRTEVPVDFTRTISRMVEDRTAEYPDRLAVTGGGNAISYAELNSRANRLARHLQSLGTTPEKLVGVCLRRSPEMVVALLAVLKSGGAYVPLDPDYPPDRLAYTLNDAGAQILVTDLSLADAIAEYSGVRVFIDDDWDAERYADTNLPDAPAANHLAYVIYTSGSTGRPKGVEIEHRGLTNFVRWHCRRYSITPEDRAAQVASPGFDASVWELWSHLSAGASLHICAEELRFSPEQLLKWMADEQITIAFATTALAVAMLALPMPPRLRLRALLTGGEKMHRSPGAFPFELVNHYGPTETTVAVTEAAIPGDCIGAPTIGKPLDNVRAYILDESRQPVPIGLPGEIYLGGVGVGRGYHNRPELTAERFVADPFRPGERLYRTGDLARFRADAQIEFIGRVDDQVKLRGFRVEPGEIEAVIAEAPGIKEAAVIVTERNGDQVLAAYLVPTSSKLEIAALRSYLKAKLPHYMVPAAIAFIPKLPLNPNGKVDRRALPPPVFESEATPAKQAPVSGTEQIISEIWKEILGVSEVGRDDNFFDLGGHSLLLTKVHKRLERELGITFSIVNLFAHPTVSALAEFLKSEQSPEPKVDMLSAPAPQSKGRAAAYAPIAIIGMAGRFPGAQSTDELWQLVSEGREAIQHYSDEELLAAGVDRKLLEDPNYVKAGTSLDAPEWFDAKFFGMSAREADITDPQHRLLLECAHQALESSACDPQTYPGRIGVFTGAGISSYFLHNVYTNASAMESVGPFQALLGMDKDFAATRISYKLNLRGPSFSVQTACSTSLVAVHLACQSLLEGACEVALAGGVSVFFPQKQGYMFQPAGILSPDGHCRAFDAEAQGTVPSNGAAVVVLKRLDDALRDGDTIHAVIRGSAINNDGSLKVGYTAPSVEGQSQVIRAAQAAAGVAAEDITYIETHGTGTALGDPIEVEALRQAFASDRRQFCALSSLKSNVGHLDAAAGVAGLIKATLALKHRQFPPTVHFSKPNPKLDLSASPFYVNDSLRTWEVSDGAVRRAGVSSFGIGGTNAHVILEEAPKLEDVEASGRPLQLLVLSAKTATALQAATDQLAVHLAECAEADLADVTFTLHCGRTAYPYRKALVVRSLADAVKGLKEPGREITSQGPAGKRTVTFMFTGQGAQHPGMAHGLYEHEPAFRREVDACAELFEPELGLDLRTLLFADANDENARRQLNQTWLTQPALFTIEYALARWWMHLGLQPEGMIGHSIGEYVAACLASVFSLRDAVRIVALRGRLMQRMPSGAMLSVAASEADVRAILPAGLDIAALNSSLSCVVSGQEELVAAFERATEGKFESRRLRTSHAFHSAMFDPMMKEFESALAQFTLNEPQLPFISNLSGDWIEPQQARSPQYWSAHLRSTVRFAEGVATLAKSGAVLIECGPGNTLSSLARQGLGAGAIAIPTLPHARQEDDDFEFATRALARLWTLGGEINWKAYHDGEHRRRLSLPTYPFERQRHWVEPGKPVHAAQSRIDTGKRKNIDEWFFSPSWQRTASPSAAGADAPQSWVVFDDGSRFAASFVEQLRGDGHRVARVIPGPAYRNGGETFHARITSAEDIAAVLRTLPEQAANFVHFWSGLASQAGDRIGFDSLLSLAKAESQVRLGKADRFVVVSTRLRDVLGDEIADPAQAAILGLAASLPIELPGISTISIDLDRAESTSLVPWLIADSSKPQPDAVVAYRGRHRWVRNWRPMELGASPANAWLEEGRYLITGGTGGIGLQLAKMLAKERNAHLALVSRTPLPPRSQWEQLASAAGPQSARISALLEVERDAAELLLIPGDIGNCSDAESAFRAAIEQFVKIDVVIHAAGERVSGTIETIERAECDRQFAAKIPGTQNVHYLAERFEIPRVIAVSSIASALGVYGHAAYAAAHSALDAFATLRRTKAAWTNVNLDNWIADEAAALPGEGELVMTPAEGREVFRRIFRSGAESVFVSTGEPSARAARAGSLVVDEAAETSGVAHPRPALSSSYTAPRNEIEKKFAAAWQDILGCDEVGIHDNFFELGGDSVMALQLVARVRPFGLTISPKQVYESPTIAELAGRHPTIASPAVARQIEGAVPLSPIQSWFFDQEFPDRHHFNHALLLKVDSTADSQSVRAALRSIVECHDALRLRFRRDGERWIQEAGGLEVAFEILDMRGIPDEKLTAEIEATCERVQRSLDLERGPVFRAALFECGDTRESRLLLVAHHLVVDLASWQIIVHELGEALRTDGPRALPAKSCDFRAWADRIATQAEAGVFDNELGYWTDRLQAVQAILTDFEHPGRCDEASAVDVGVSYPKPSTQLLLQDSTRAFMAQPQDLLLAALCLALGPRCANSLVVDIEGTGREPIFPDFDIGGTVGWFTSMYPVRLHAPGSDPADVIRSVRNELRGVPRDGVGFGALRYISSNRDVQDRLQRLPSPDVLFLFHGRQELGKESKSALHLTSEPCGQSNSSRNLLSHKLTLSAAIKDDCLHFDWKFSTRLFRRETVEGFARGLCSALDSFNAAASAMPRSAGASARISSHDLQKVLTRMQSAK